MLHIREPRTLKTPAGGHSLSISDITADAAELPSFDGHERVWCGRDERRGLTAIVAIHDTTLGPALGGTRIWPHESFEAAVTDALRLSRGMTYKSAVAGLPLGGGKAVIVADAKTQKTPALLTAYAEMLTALEGQFITAEDVGMTLADADFLRERAPNVVGTSKGGSGNPSPFTAEGVFLGIKKALKHRNGSARLSGIRVAVQGLGSVGWSLCEKLSREDADLIVTDLDAMRVEKARRAFGATAIAADEVVAAEAEVFAPCALGGVISQETLRSLKSGIVAGSANNQLARHEDARLLMERGVLYAPDYVINAGGLINVAAELSPLGYDPEAVMARLGKIPTVLGEIFARAEAQKRPTNDIAAEIAMERIRR
ncbi:Glu/Leu/Phe/Val dehydrogenase dimerization domain-containing protein [Chelativorans sp. AA-79]|uniref:Glu/Leu/Phe/Val family dehydrogenase n=1 Tax=Chelativorans sp. AA-79 TaxID=3028735 RepID=UPI0023F8D890|nr:Glu/Leu/Phe/Val dehydrogenase dimerization domain-containing protein [Chelativorans sp. AA-79]WEX09939.1 Glu/Leu/Phe/Val dehydrogenase dimerization domain-containing protein [Chelativorans sp. AA-79]